MAGAALGATQGDLEGWTKRLSDIAKESESLGPVYFGAAYSLATVLLIPASVLTLAAGYLFGPIKGTIVVSMSSTTGAALAFGLARTVLRPYVFRWLEAYPKFVAVDKAVSEEGARVVFLLRLSPLFPFGLSNYMFGLTSIDFISYIGASWIGMLPGTFLYVYLGSAGQAVQNVGLDGAQSGKIALYVVGLIATLLATKTVTSAASRALEESAREDS